VIEFGHSFAALRRLHFCTSGALRRSSNRQIPAFIPPMLRRPRRHHSGSHTRQIGHCSVGRVGHEGNPYALNGDSPYDSQRWCASPPFLHRHRWSHPRGAPRGQPRRHGSRDDEQHRGDGEDSRVPRPDLKQQRRQPASEHQRTHDTGGQTTPDDDGGLPQHQCAHVGGVAPSAIRIPISGVRWRTVQASTP
jgi:hypothetical protein